jgi:hypothetical protein
MLATGVLATSMLLSSGALAQDAQDFTVDNPLSAIFGGIFGLAAPPANAEPPSRSNDAPARTVVLQQGKERFVNQGEPDERGYVRTTVKGRAVLVDPRTRRIVEVLE